MQSWFHGPFETRPTTALVDPLVAAWTMPTTHPRRGHRSARINAACSGIRRAATTLTWPQPSIDGHTGECRRRSIADRPTPKGDTASRDFLARPRRDTTRDTQKPTAAPSAAPLASAPGVTRVGTKRPRRPCSRLVQLSPCHGIEFLPSQLGGLRCVRGRRGSRLPERSDQSLRGAQPAACMRRASDASA